MPQEGGFPRRYRLIRTLGKGAMGQVFLGEYYGERGFRRRVAIKKLLEHAVNKATIEALINEARVGGLLDHRNVVSVLDFGQEGGSYYIVMGFVEGEPLEVLLQFYEQKLHKRVPLDITLQILSHVCAGLSELHNARSPDEELIHAVHRDVKPANILLSWRGDVRIADYGVVRSAVNVERTELGIAKGTVLYMSPEQVFGRANLDHRSDLFAVGTIFYRMVTGDQLYGPTSDDPGLITSRVAQADNAAKLLALPEMPARFRVSNFLEKALQSEPGRRFQSAREMADALDKIRDELNSRLSLQEWLDETQEELETWKGTQRVNPGLYDMEPTELVLGAATTGVGGGLAPLVTSTTSPVGVGDSTTALVPPAQVPDREEHRPSPPGLMATLPPAPSSGRSRTYLYLGAAALALFGVITWGVGSSQRPEPLLSSRGEVTEPLPAPTLHTRNNDQPQAASPGPLPPSVAAEPTQITTGVKSRLPGVVVPRNTPAHRGAGSGELPTPGSEAEPREKPAGEPAHLRVSVSPPDGMVTANGQRGNIKGLFDKSDLTSGSYRVVMECGSYSAIAMVELTSAAHCAWTYECDAPEDSRVLREDSGTHCGEVAVLVVR